MEVPMDLGKGAAVAWCWIRCESCGQTFDKQIGWATFAADVFRKEGWRRSGKKHGWLCPECSDYHEQGG